MFVRYIFQTILTPRFQVRQSYPKALHFFCLLFHNAVEWRSNGLKFVSHWQKSWCRVFFDRCCLIATEEPIRVMFCFKNTSGQKLGLCLSSLIFLSSCQSCLSLTWWLLRVMLVLLCLRKIGTTHSLKPGLHYRKRLAQLKWNLHGSQKKGFGSDRIGSVNNQSVPNFMHAKPKFLPMLGPSAKWS